jgi:hypothetical protein
MSVDADAERVAIMFGRVAVLFEIMLDRRDSPLPLEQPTISMK